MPSSYILKMYLNPNDRFLGINDKWFNFYNLPVGFKVWVDSDFKLIQNISQSFQKYKTVPYYIITRENYICNYGEESDMCNCFLFLQKEGDKIIDATALIAICEGEQLTIYNKT